MEKYINLDILNKINCLHCGYTLWDGHTLNGLNFIGNNLKYHSKIIIKNEVFYSFKTFNKIQKVIAFICLGIKIKDIKE